MSPQRIYVRDTCCLASDTRKLGLAGRTFGDVDSHATLLGVAFPHGVRRHPNVAYDQYESFSLSGIPPEGTVVIEWISGDELGNVTLVAESDLLALDRELLIGDVVKKDPKDAISGVVLSTRTYATLAQPQRWPASFDPQDMEAFRSADLESMLIDVPGDELTDTLVFRADEVVVYGEWIGRIMDYWPSVKVRLSNGSVVELEDPEELKNDDVTGSDPRDVQVGDIVQTTKGNLRRGTWIFGAYDANVQPKGFVVEVRVVSIEVQWLVKRARGEMPSTGMGSPDKPPDELNLDELEGDSIHIYESYKAPTPNPNDVNETGWRSLELSPSDKIRFRDVDAAITKYGNRLRRIPRTETLGFDINVFTVVSTRTDVTVQWQDMSRSTHGSVDLVPGLDFSNDDEVWPGELIMPRGDPIDEDDMDERSGPFFERVGVVQSVRSLERIARVRWFETLGTFQGPLDGSLQPVVPTSSLHNDVEEVSLYEIMATPGLARRLGDYVHFCASTDLAEEDLARFPALAQIIQSPSSSNEWIGEVVELGLDGLLTIRLGASDNLREVRVPWSSTLIAYAVDNDDSDDMLDEEEGDDDGSDDDVAMGDIDLLTEAIQGQNVLRRQPSADGQDSEWETDEEEGDDEEEQAVGVDNETNMMDTPTMETVSATSGQIDGDKQTLHFSYERMLTNCPAKSRPEPFLVLDGEVPSDHFYARRIAPSANPQRLRRIQREHRILASSLPAGQVWVRSWESSLDLLRVLILGPLGTPYKLAPFVVDIYLDQSFPNGPPKTFFHSWTDGNGPINPNLYEDGTICLSLLGTWPGNTMNDTWTSKSTILQVLVSLIGLVLVKEPYYNEAGYEVRTGAIETRIPSQLYSERAFLNSRLFIHHAFIKRPGGLGDIFGAIYMRQDQDSPMLLLRAIWDVVQKLRHQASSSNNSNGEAPASGDSAEGIGRARVLSAGACIPLRRQTKTLITWYSTHVDQHTAALLDKMIDDDMFEPEIGKNSPLDISRSDAFPMLHPLDEFFSSGRGEYCAAYENNGDASGLGDIVVGIRQRRNIGILQ